MKGYLIRLVTIILSVSILFTLLAGCTPGGTENQDNVPPDLPDVLLGITEDTVWVGNTIDITGEYAAIGNRFKLGIEAAFAAYNADGGYNGKSIKLKHYDAGVADSSQDLTRRLIFEDEVFAIVGSRASYEDDENLQLIKDAAVPMIYPVSDCDALINENATSAGDKAVFPVRPLSFTEGRMLLLRALAPKADEDGDPLGGFGASKVGVISSSSEVSASILAGIKAEAGNLGEDKTRSIIYREVVGTDYSAAAKALKAAGCDLVILAVTGDDFLAALSAMADVSYYRGVLTVSANASAEAFNSGDALAPEYQHIFSSVIIYAHSWLDISSFAYVYNEETELNAAYRAEAESQGLDYNGTRGFSEAYWDVAEQIYSYALASFPDSALQISRDPYALEGYIAGDLFCQAMEALERSGKALSRANLVRVMESEKFRVAMADEISFADGMRTGVQSFGLIQIYDVFHFDVDYGGGVYHYAQSTTVHGLTSIDDYRLLVGE